MSETKQPTNQEIYEWIRSQGYVIADVEYGTERALYLDDMPGILREYVEWLSKRDG